MRWLAIALLMAAPVFAQLEANTITVTATRQMILQPDQAAFVLIVNSGTSDTLDQVAAALAGLNVTAADLSGINTSSPATLQWSFSLAVPIANLTTTLASITNLQQTIGQNNSGLSLSFIIDGTQVSSQLRQSQSCSNSDLIADATAQAQKIAAAAGLTLGPILKVSNAPSVQPAAVRAGEFISGVFSALVFTAPPALPLTCTAVVQFQALR